MVFRRRNKTEQRPRRAREGAEDNIAADRLRSIGETGGYEFSPDEREDVEARIRRMRYGAKQEGSAAATDDES
jgi:hypothetical protein